MFSRILILPALLLTLTAGICAAATPKEIEGAVKKGTGFLKDQYDGVRPAQLAKGAEGIGPVALAGLALLETGAAADDEVVKTIAAGVRDAAFAETRTYQIALCILFLDRLGDSADTPLIQMLAVRLLAGQNSRGGWTYSCIDSVPAAEETRLRAALMATELKAGGTAPAPPVAGKAPANPARHSATGKLHAEVEKYAGKLVSSSLRDHGDDNSNTQFGVLGVWVARKHGAPVERSLELIEARFLATQTVTGGWPYAGPMPGSPSMTCAGLIGLATAVGRREERRLQAEQPRTEPSPKPAPVAKTNPTDPQKPSKPATTNEDPFYNPPPPKPAAKPDDPFFDPPKAERASPAEKKPTQAAPKANNAAKPRPHPRDARDLAVERGLAALAQVLAGNAPPQPRGKGRGGRIMAGGMLGDRDFYFFWSLERVGVIFGLDKIGNVDWYDVGAEELVAVQNADGSWGRGGRGNPVDTSFALLFLSRSNLVRDLSGKVQQSASNTELRAGGGPHGVAPAPAPAAKPTSGIEPASSANAPLPTPTIPAAPPAEPEPKALASSLIWTTGTDWDKTLEKLRDGKGSAYTQSLAIAAARLDGDRRKAARAALADRLTRMTADTLRTMAQDKEEPELRRAAVLAMAMKDDKGHIPDLIAAIQDDEDAVVRAAHAGLKSLTGEDFGPAPGANRDQRKAAAHAWEEWLKKSKK